MGFGPSKGKQEASSSFDESVDRPPKSLQDLREMQDDFASDSDAAPRAPGERETVREVVHAERVLGRPYEDESSADPFADDARVEGVFSPDKLRFISLPEPMAVAGSRRAAELEDVIDSLDHADPMLRITQSKIRGFRNYLHVVEREEVLLLSSFHDDVGRAPASVPEGIREQEGQRVLFEHKLAEIRDRRARFRGLLYDAIQERGAIVKSHLAQHGVNYRAQSKLDYWRDRSGLDRWLMGFFVASLLVVVCYIVFLTFPSVPAPQFRAVLTPPTAFEFDYRVMILTSLFVVVGMSFWMASYKRFQWSALGLNLVLIGWSIEFGLLMHVFFEWAFISGFKQVPLTARLTSLAIYSAATVLCAHAVLLGRVNATQSLVMATAQCICFAVICGFQRFFGVLDTGGGVAVWIFGGVFGLTASVVYALDGEHHKPGKKRHTRQQGKRYNEELKDNSHPRRHSYRSTGFAWIGALVLWVMWPAFNSAFAPATAQQRVMATTFLALVFSTISAIGLSELLFRGKHTLRPFVNSTLAGGVAMSCAHSVLVPPWIAALLGFVVGLVSVLGEWRLTRWLEDRFKVYDTQGVLFTIVVPASIGFLVSEIVTAVAIGKVIWSTAFATNFVSTNQSGYLAASWALALGFAVIIGVGTGFLLRYLRPSARKNQLWREDGTFVMGKDYAVY